MLIIGMVAAVFFWSVPGTKGVQLKYSTYLGGMDDDYAKDITVGSDGTAYVTGLTFSSDFPSWNSYQPSLSGDHDAFVTRFSSIGSSLLFSTYLGGSSSETPYGIALDTLGYIYVVGWTLSQDFPTAAPLNLPFQPAPGGGLGDGFITQFQPDGSSLYYSSYLGGSAQDSADSVAVGSDNSAYITGYTESDDFPTRPGAFQSGYGGGLKDGFAAKVSPNGTSLTYATYLGGSLEDKGNDIAVDVPGFAYIVGTTYSSNFPTAGDAFHSSLTGGSGDSDAFITQLRPDGASLYYSTYLGGTDEDKGISIDIDINGTAYLVGETSSTDFPTANPYQASRAGGGSLGEVYISRLSNFGSSLIYSTYLGGSDNEDGEGITVDDYGYAYLTGTTDSTDFPVLYPYQSTFGGGDDDAFAVKLCSSGSAICYSTYLGGSGDDQGAAIAIDPAYDAYVTGQTNSPTGFPVFNPYQSSLAGGTNYDGFISKLSFSVSPSDKQYHYDYNGDGTSDIAIFRGTTGLWAVRGVTRAYFGVTDDQPAPGDYNGDGTTEIGIFRHTSGLWAIRGVTRAYFGTAYDWSEPGDYNGDGTWNIAIFRRTNGLWAVRGVTRAYFGGAYDNPSPGYFDGDNSLDFALFRPTSGLWAARGVTRFYFGGSSDTPRAGDYNGDGLWEGGIFRSSSGLWAIRGVTRSYFGSGYTDASVPADYNGNGRDDIAIFRYSSGLWAVSGLTRVYFGGASDEPVAR